MKPLALAPCPCGSGAGYAQCCGRMHSGSPAADALALMRSRYSAYAMRLDAYLLATWHPDTRPAQLENYGNVRWLGLDVRRHAQTASDSATVEFVARYRLGGRGHRMHEVSRFHRQEGRWYYVDAESPSR